VATVDFSVPDEVKAQFGKASAVMESVMEGELEILQPVYRLAEVAAIAARLTPSKAVRDVELPAALELPTIADPNVSARATSLAIGTRHHLFDMLYLAVALEHEDAMLVTAGGRYFAKARRCGRITTLHDWKSPA
jgi:predicted nucleic acid-binding protein